MHVLTHIWNHRISDSSQYIWNICRKEKKKHKVTNMHLQGSSVVINYNNGHWEYLNLHVRVNKDDIFAWTENSLSTKMNPIISQWWSRFIKINTCIFWTRHLFQWYLSDRDRIHYTVVYSSKHFELMISEVCREEPPHWVCQHWNAVETVFNSLIVTVQSYDRKYAFNLPPPLRKLSRKRWIASVGEHTTRGPRGSTHARGLGGNQCELCL